jgi:hypothetical protein
MGTLIVGEESMSKMVSIPVRQKDLGEEPLSLQLRLNDFVIPRWAMKPLGDCLRRRLSAARHPVPQTVSIIDEHLLHLLDSVLA